MLSDQDIAFFKRFSAKFKCAEHRVKLRGYLPSTIYYGFGSRRDRTGRLLRSVAPARISFTPDCKAVHPYAILVEERPVLGSIEKEIAELFKSNSFPAKKTFALIRAFGRGLDRFHNDYDGKTIEGQLYYYGLWVRQDLSNKYWGSLGNDKQWILSNMDNRLVDYLT